MYPALHWQAVLVVLPAGETESAGQAEQAAGPAPALYSSTSHCEQAPPFAPVWPALHRQAVSAVLPAGELASEGHIAQGPGPVPDLYEPAGHSEHAPAPSLNPALHTHSVLPSVSGLDPVGQEKGTKHICNKSKLPGMNVLDTPVDDLDAARLQLFEPGHIQNVSSG